MRNMLFLGMIALLGGCAVADHAPAVQRSEHPHCPIFLAATEYLAANAVLPSELGAPKDMGLWHFALSLPYPDAPFSRYLEQYFPELRASDYVETTLPAGTSYDDFDRTDQSDGYAVTCAWHQQEGRNWVQETPRIGHQMIFFRPSIAPDGRSAVVMVGAREIFDYGHSVHVQPGFRRLCHISRTRNGWHASACREAARLDAARPE